MPIFIVKLSKITIVDVPSVGAVLSFHHSQETEWREMEVRLEKESRREETREVPIDAADAASARQAVERIYPDWTIIGKPTRRD